MYCLAVKFFSWWLKKHTNHCVLGRETEETPHLTLDTQIGDICTWTGSGPHFTSVGKNRQLEGAADPSRSDMLLFGGAHLYRD